MKNNEVSQFQLSFMETVVLDTYARPVRTIINGKCVEVHWFRHENDSLYLSEWLDEDGNLHRDNDLPARIIHHDFYGGFDRHGITWFKHGIEHRVNKASSVTHDNDGNITEERWMINGKYYERKDDAGEHLYNSRYRCFNGWYHVWKSSDGNQIKEERVPYFDVPYVEDKDDDEDVMVKPAVDE